MTRSQSEVLVVVGTRPEIIKMAPVLRALGEQDHWGVHLVHTDQHYDVSLSDVFFRDLGIETPDTHLGIGSHPHGTQTARGLEALATLLREREPAVALAQGDTNAVLSTALAASKQPVLFGHVEAGIRSYDRSMPEEVNRVIADVVADLRFAPTEAAAENLRAEGIESGVHVTGNTIVDTCQEHADIAQRTRDTPAEFDLEQDAYVLATIHRPRNTDDPRRLSPILRSLNDLDAPVILPAHPRTREAMDELDESFPDVRVTGPLDYLDFLSLQQHARVIVTDSGGIQEEASILEVPCVTVRPNTERPETVDAGVNLLVEPDELADTLAEIYHDSARRAAMRGHPHLYGDGDAAKRIVELIARQLSEPQPA